LNVQAESAIGLRGPRTAPANGSEREILGEDQFRRRVAIERKRTERSREPFLLMLLDSVEAPADQRVQLLNRTLAALAPATRETDIIGWRQESVGIGVLFIGLSESEKVATRATILNRTAGILSEALTEEQFGQIAISFHFFPDDWNPGDPEGCWNPALYPDLVEPDENKRAMLGVKRLIDLLGASFLLLFSSPLLLAIAIAVKTTSKGPLLFRQFRVGQYGRRFVFFKFRSMYVNNDDNVHREYVSRLIAGNAERISTDGRSEGVYKLANDKRITPLGRFLRRTSLDELPQFFSVLVGDMSLVGPRPPLPYELAACKTWHRRRLLVRPGITGLWQVKGRSRVSFEEMVRLDLQYASEWSPWLDIKLLLRTPGAVIKGAY
jgi:lipopolysaccharide/colanic/teichoic acid biosynthesis glycosyltransferase